MHEKYLSQTFILATKAQGLTSPNPMVGAVIVKNGKIIGQGYHEKFGQNHAEVNAINSAKESCVGATIYVSLEPCGHFGNTPPCVDAIIKSGIAKVVFAISDPNKNSVSDSVKILEDARIKVESGFLESEARKLNEQYFYFHENNKPFVALKFAASLDGKLATKSNDSKWITNEAARSRARELRSFYQAILVGANTVINDNPSLDSRIKNTNDPLRIILDTKLKTDTEAKVYKDKNVLVFCGSIAKKQDLERLKKAKINVIQLNTESIKISELLRELAKLNIISLMVEGGGSVLGSFLEEKSFNRVYAFYAPILVGGESAVSIGGNGFTTIKDSPRLKNTTIDVFDDNYLITGDYIN